MHDFRRVLVSTIALVLVATSSVVTAQGTLNVTLAADARGAALFEELLQDSDHLVARYAEVRRAMSDGLRALGAELSDKLPTTGICVHLVGTSGATPRLDGGGDVLAAMGDRFDPQRANAHPSQERILEYHDGTHLYVIDEFSIEALAVLLRGLIGRADVAQHFGLSPDVDPLWQATYGYRIALVGDPEQPESTSVPHGHLVAYHLLSQLPQNSMIQNVRMSPNERRVEVDVQHGESSLMKIHFVAMEFARLSTIPIALNELPDDGSAAVVLSWGLVDCLLAAGYAALPAESGFETIMEYFAAAVRAMPDFEGYLRDVCRAFDEARYGHLLGFTQGQSCNNAPAEHLVGLATVIAVAGFSELARAQVEWELAPEQHRYFAAAGNQGLGFPMPPAAWPEVVGVEACAAEVDENGNPSASPYSTKASFSNVGPFAGTDAARALGAWFQTPEVRSDGEPLGYWGTSFAAPTAALRYLATESQTETCQ